MAGIKLLRKLQIGKEATAGTAVAATTIWRGLGMLKDTRVKVRPSEDIGYLSKVDRQYEPMLGGELSMPSVEATYEQIGHIFEAGIKLVQTGAADGSGSGKIYTYTYPVTAANTTRTYTIEGGDNEAAEEMEYAYVSDFTIDGEAGGSLNITANWKGRQISTSAFTGALVLPDVEEMIFSKGKLYIDAIGGTIGTTQKSNTLIKMSYKADTGLRSVNTANGVKYFSFTKQVGATVSMDITFEHDSISVAEKAAYVAGTSKLVRVKFDGSTLTTAGSTYSTKSLILDMAGKWSNFTEIQDSNGNDIIVGTFEAAYNSTAALFARNILVNTLTSLP